MQTIALSSSPVTLSVPAGFTATPTGGPTQAQNAVLRFTGTLTTNVTVTLPMPGFYIIENLTTGNFLVTLRAVTATQIICVDQGMIQHVYNDGVNVRFVNFGETGKMELWGGRIAMPPWVTNCTVPPYLLCDGTVYNFSTYPYLGIRLGSQFGGNGVTTFGVPDLQGRVPLAYDGTGARITSAGSNLNGQVMGAAGGNQIPATHSHANSLSDPGHFHTTPVPTALVAYGSGPLSANAGNLTLPSNSDTKTTGISITNASAFTGASGNIQPSQIAGIWVIRAA